MEADERWSEADDEGETSENEMLWREMELCLASSYILDDNEARVDNEAFQKATGDCGIRSEADVVVEDVKKSGQLVTISPDSVIVKWDSK